MKRRQSLSVNLIKLQQERRSLDSAQEFEQEDESEFEKVLKSASSEPQSADPKLLKDIEAFGPEREREWFMWLHETIIGYKVMRRFGAEAILITLLSGFELAFMIRKEVWHYSHPVYRRGFRWPVFVYSRGLVIFICMVMWYVAETSSWFLRNPRTAQSLMLASSCLTIVVMFISYDSLVVSGTPEYQSHQEEFFRAPEDQCVTLNLVLFIFLSTRLHPYLFVPSLVFIPVATLAMASRNIYTMVTGFHWKDVFSYQGQLLVFAQVLLNVAVAYDDEHHNRARFKAMHAVEATEKQTYNILNTLMPPLVVKRLHQLPPGAIAPSHQYRHATIAQSDLCGFTQLSSTKSPREVVSFMGELFGAFDELTDKHEVYKVETIGDAYIAGMAEHPLTERNSPLNVVLFSLDMVRAVDVWATKLGVKVTCRVGVAYGECTGGIVGTDMQRYHLFGDLLTTMEVLESTSVEGRVQASVQAVREVERQLRDYVGVPAESISFEMRTDEHLQTSKGEVFEYSTVGGQSYLVQSDVELRSLHKDP